MLHQWKWRKWLYAWRRKLLWDQPDLKEKCRGGVEVEVGHLLDTRNFCQKRGCPIFCAWPQDRKGLMCRILFRQLLWWYFNSNERVLFGISKSTFLSKVPTSDKPFLSKYCKEKLSKLLKERIRNKQINKIKAAIMFYVMSSFDDLIEFPMRVAVFLRRKKTTQPCWLAM